MKLAGKALMSGAALAALSLMLAPALAATQQQKARQTRPTSAISIGTFTPAVADPRLAAELARRGFSGGGFRFTPATTTSDRNRAVRVAVRARAATPGEATRRADGASATQVTAITPTAYNLGVSVGWRSFALSGDVARVEGGVLPGGKQAAQVGVSYARSRFSGRVEVGADRTDPTTPKAIAELDSYSVGVGGSYRIARNLDVTGGLRYKIQRDRLEPLADERRDSQAVYIGTAFRF